MMLQPYIPGLVEALVADFTATGRPAVPAGRRDELVRTLLSVANGAATVDEYAGLLAGAFGVGVVPPAAPDDLPLQEVLREGPGVLSDDQLARVALNPAAVRELSERVTAAMAYEWLGQCWTDALNDIVIPPEHHEAADRGIAEFRRLERETRPGTENSSPD